MKRQFSSLKCLGNWHSVLLHCLNQCLSYARCQLHYLLYRVCLNQKAGEGWASRQINAFLQMLNFNRENISCHRGNILAENGCKFNFDTTHDRTPWALPRLSRWGLSVLLPGCRGGAGTISGHPFHETGHVASVAEPYFLRYVSGVKIPYRLPSYQLKQPA